MRTHALVLSRFARQLMLAMTVAVVPASRIAAQAADAPAGRITGRIVDTKTGQGIAAAGVQVVTFRFKSISLDLSHSVSVIDNLTVAYPTETIVYDGVVPGVDDFGVGIPATITQLDCSTIYWYRDSDGDGEGDRDGDVDCATAMATGTAMVEATGYGNIDGNVNGGQQHNNQPTTGAANADDCSGGDGDSDGGEDANESRSFSFWLCYKDALET